MKKILLSSLLAVMAVTSANAKIASTGYVDAAEAAAEAAANTYTDEKIDALDATTNGDGDFVIGVAQTDGKVTVTKGNIDYSDLAGIPTVDTAMSDSSENAVQNKVIKSYVDTEVGKKQDTLSTEQLAAVNSGITEGKVTTYDGYATGKQNTLSTEQLAAVNSGITTDKVTAITQNTTDIAAITTATVATVGQEDGQYVLTKKVVDGAITYSWESIDRTLAN